MDLDSGSERLYLLYFKHVSVLQLSSTSREGGKKGFRGFKKRMSGEDERKDEIKKRRREEEEEGPKEGRKEEVKENTQL